MSLEENKAIVHRWIEAENKKDLAVLDELMAADYFDPSMPVRGREGTKQLMAMMTKAFPDTHETIEDIIAEEDKVVSRFTFQGTHTGEFMGIAPTGREVTVMQISIDRIADGKIVEHWGLVDQLSLLQQLGVGPLIG